VLRRSLASGSVVLGVLLSSPLAVAGGWQEVHQSADDVRVAVGPDGIATVEHRLRYRIVAGRFKSLDVTGIDTHAELVPDSVAVPEKGTEVPAHVEMDATAKVPGTVKLTFDDPKGLSRGSYVIAVKYKLDLVSTKMLVKDGAMWRLTWAAPAAVEGRDGARVVFELPPAPTEPRLASPEQAQTTLATLRRQTDKDELELVRAHVPRGEAVLWSARVDPKAFPKIAAPELRRTPQGPVAPADSPPARAVFIALALATLAGLLAFALRVKQSAVAAETAARFAVAHPVVPLSRAFAPYAYGAVGTASLAALLWGTPLHGGLLAVLAMALAAHRTPARVARPRGPGRWTPMPDEEVLVESRSARPRPGDALDLSTGRGRLTLLGVVLAIGVASFGLRAILPGAAIAIPLASAVLVPLFATGMRAQMPRTPEELASRFLRPTRDALGAIVDLAHVELGCVARLRERTREIDEVRLACAPGERIPGLRAIELAPAPTAREGALPEVLVRFDDGTAVAAKIAKIAPGVPIVPGRAPEEKVLCLRPSTPTPLAAARLLARVLEELEERRTLPRPPRPRRYEGPERRVALTAFRAAAATA
jgi:hypothetical protein